MAAALVTQQGHGLATTDTTWAITCETITVGSTLVLFLRAGVGSGGTLTNVTDTGGNTWVIPAGAQGGVSGVSNTFIATAYCHNAAQPGTITLTHASFANRLVKIFELSGVSRVAPNVATEDFTNAATTTDIRSAAGLPSEVGVFLIGVANYGGTVYTTGVNATWTAAANPPNTGGRLSTAYKLGSAVGAEQVQFTGLSTGVRYGGVLIGFKATQHGASVVALTADADITNTARKVGVALVGLSSAADVSAAAVKVGLSVVALTADADVAVAARKAGLSLVPLTSDADTDVTTRKVGASAVGLVADADTTVAARKVGLSLVPVTADTDTTVVSEPTPGEHGESLITLVADASATVTSRKVGLSLVPMVADADVTVVARKVGLSLVGSDADADLTVVSREHFEHVTPPDRIVTFPATDHGAAFPATDRAVTFPPAPRTVVFPATDRTVVFPAEARELIA